MVTITKDTSISNVDFAEGALILVDKPLGWTSFDVVNKIRFPLRKKYEKKKFKVGHNGTLDPLATGLLMIFTGKYTKRIPMEENHDKRYIGQVKLGATTETLDREGAETNICDVAHITKQQILTTAESFIGEQIQEIPSYSATKVNGVAMYKLARQKKAFKPKSKTVIFHEISVLDYQEPIVEVDILCGKGTYIRAFARDLGKGLDCSAYLYGLRRTAIANYSVEDAVDVKTICEMINDTF